MDILNGTGTALMSSVATGGSTTFASLVPVIVGIAGLYLGFYVVKQVIGLIPRSHGKK